jgi:hypothetical protein
MVTWKLIFRRMVCGGLLWLAWGTCLDDTAAQQATSGEKSVSAAQLDAWIEELGAREFDTRDRAMHALIAVGKMAIEPALQATSRGDHEVATRAVMILKGVGEKGDIATLEAVLAALTRVAESSTLPVGRRAAEVRDRLESVRQDRTADFFRALGAEVTPEFTDTWTSSFLAAPVYSVEFGANWKGTDEDLDRLKWLRDAEQVCLVGPKITDDWIRHLREMPRLISIKIKHAAVTPKAVEELAKLDRLRVLRLQFVPLGDEMIPYLEKCEGLIRLVVISRALTPAGENRLKERFNERVEFPRGAMLGVKAGLEEPWSIREVIPGSAADKAGLRPFDRIVKYDGQPVATFQELRTLIAKCEPGDSASFEVERGFETIQMKVTFGEWD